MFPDINECLTAGCPADCQNTEGGYKCKCPSGYRQADNGKDCTGTVCACVRACMSVCVCVCVCVWRRGRSKIDIIPFLDVDECAVSNGHCEQICNNTVGGYDCLCFSGFTSINNSCLSKYMLLITIKIIC